jgi:hypothetical protein
MAKYSPAVLLGQANTWTSDQTFNDNVKVTLGTGGDADIYYNGTNLVIEPQVVGTGDIVINDAATLFLNETANGDMTTGVTIQKGAETDHAITLKSNVTNGFSSLVEVDTFAFIQEFSSDGGVLIAGYASGANGMEVRGSAAAAIPNTDTTSSRAIITLTSREDDGSNGQQAVASGNLVCIRNMSTTRFIFKEDGELHIGNTTLATLSDSWDDAGLVRAFSTNTGDPDTLIRSEWDNFVQYHHDDLVRAGIIGYVSPEEQAEGVTGLWNVSQHLRLLNGASWQIVEDVMSIVSVLSDDQRRGLTPRLQNRLHALADGRN